MLSLNLNKKWMFGIVLLFGIVLVGLIYFISAADSEVEHPINYQVNEIYLGNGRFAQTSSLGFINYYNGSGYAPINTTLIPYNQDGYNYKSKEGIYSFYVKSNSNWGDGTKYCSNESGEYCLTYQAQDMSFRDINGAQDYITSIQGAQGVINDTKIKYVNAFLNTDLEYATHNQLVKENFILKGLSRTPTSDLGENITLDFGGYIKFPNLDMYVNNTKITSNIVTNEKIEFRKDNITLFFLPKPYAYDSNGNSVELSYEVKIRGQQIWFYVRTPYSWLKNSSRAYPIFIDPLIGPRDPTLGVNVADVGINWLNPTNIYSSNDIRATAALTDVDWFSDLLRATGFGFTIPTGATIDGIIVEIEKSATVADLINDYFVYIVKGGTETGTDHSSGNYWPLTTDAYTTYGTSTDKWGTTWTSADINATNFGVSISASNNDVVTRSARVDHVRITVYYTATTSCTCPAINTNWAINMADSCNIKTTCNLGTGNISWVGTGTTIFNATISAKKMNYPITNQKLKIGSNARVKLG